MHNDTIVAPALFDGRNTQSNMLILSMTIDQQKLVSTLWGGSEQKIYFLFILVYVL